MEKSPDVAASSLVTDWQRPMDATATYMGPMDMAVDFKDLSTADFAAMADYDPNYLVREGYGTLVKMVALQAGLDIVLGTPVTGIDYGGPGVTVTTGGRKPGAMRAKTVIVTVSTGVLAATDIRFTPALPVATQGAIADLPMGLLAKIPLQIPGISHYIDGIAPYDNVLDESDGLDDIYFLAWPWDSDLMVGFVGGQFAWDLSKQGPAAAVAYAREKLGNIFGSNVARRVKRGLLTPWASDPLARGAYSAAKPGKHASRAILAQPVQDKLFFAGEAVAPDGMFATCSGAYMSGTMVAQAAGQRARAG
jgi:monoamine oxidase